MRKITVLSTHSMLEKVIEELHKKQVVHIIEHDKSDEIDIGSPLTYGDVVSELLVKVRSLMSLLKIEKHLPGKKIEDSYSRIRKNIESTHDEVNLLIDRLREADEKIRDNHLKIVEVQKAQSLDLPIEAFHEFGSICRFTGQVKDLNHLSDAVDRITSKYEIFTDEEEDFFALFAENVHEDQIREVLEKEGFNEVPIHLEDITGDAGKILKDLKKQENMFERSKKQINKKIEGIRNRWAPYAVDVEERLAEESVKADAPLRFASSEKAFMVTGWVLAKRVKSLRSSLEKLTRGKLYFTSQEPTSHDDIPVKLKNPKPSRSFEVLMDLFALPMYNEMDPTFLMFLTFPLFFGFMLGDWGYGITMFLLFTLLKKLIPAGRKFFNILLLSSFSTILFGILFGEFFGSEEIFGHEMWRALSRGHEMISLLIIALVIGFFHINWGLINGFINEYRNHGFRIAMLEKGAWFILQAVFGMIVLSGLHIWRLKLWVSIAFLLIPAYMIFKGEGIKGLMEIPGIFSNMLSYSRLMAIGIASVKLAEVINDFAGGFIEEGGMGILYAVLLLVVGHTVNLALGMIGPFLHSLRLHYVEYFGKFFKGGAKKFTPFGADK